VKFLDAKLSAVPNNKLDIPNPLASLDKYSFCTSQISSEKLNGAMPIPPTTFSLISTTQYLAFF